MKSMASPVQNKFLLVSRPTLHLCNGNNDLIQKRNYYRTSIRERHIVL